MKQKRLIFFILSLLLIGIMVWLIFYFLGNRKEKDVLILYGNVDVRQVDISFRVSGMIDSLCKEEGDCVAKGTLLATLDKNPYANQLEESIANREAIKNNLINSETLLKRRSNLIGVGGVTQEDLDNAQSSYNQLKANLSQAESAVNISQDNLSYTEAYAPSDGVILTRIREVGSVVKETDPVYTLSLISPVWVRAYVSEVHLGQIYYGMPAEIYTDTKNGPHYCGKIGFISPVAEFTPKTVETTQLRTDLVYRLRIYVDNPDVYLKQGMPVTVKLDLKNE